MINRNVKKSKYNLFDAHCDTITKAFNKKCSPFSPLLAVTPKQLAEYGKATQCYAIYNDGSLKTDDIINLISDFEKNCNLSREIDFCRTAKDVQTAHMRSRAAAYVTVESIGNTSDLKLSDIAKFKSAGVRMMSLTWNNDNFLCGGIENNRQGLTSAGADILKAMCENKIILDVSHMSDKGFWDACRHFDMPVCASHSNCRAVYDNRRNLTDEQIKHIIAADGVIGINFFPDFTGERENIINHIIHILQLGGSKNIGIGSDFDGIDTFYADLGKTRDIKNLFYELFVQNNLNVAPNDVCYNNFNNLFNKYEI